MKTAVLIGSSGLIGQNLLEKLVQDGSFGQVIAIGRSRKPQADAFKHPKVRSLHFDFLNWGDIEMQIKSFIGSSPSIFFCCLGTTIKQAGNQQNFKKVDHDYVVKFAGVARACRAEQLLVVSALGASKDSDVFYNQVKGEMEEDVRKEFSGKLSFFRPSLLLGDRQQFRFGERIAILLAPVYSPLLVGNLQKYHPVNAKAVASAMLLVAVKKVLTESVIENLQIISMTGNN